MSKRCITRLSTVLVILALAASAKAYETGDSQVWLTFTFSGKFTNNLSASIYENFRLGDDAKDFYYSETALLLDWTPRPWLTLGAGYTEAKNKKTKTLYDASGAEVLDEYWEYEHQPNVSVTFKGAFSGWKLDDRTRVEYRMKENTQDYFRYRNRIRLISPWKWTALKINPRTYYELNLSDLPNDVDWEFDRQRFYIGATLSLLNHINGELYYLKQLDWTGGDWREYNVFGVGLSASF